MRDRVSRDAGVITGVVAPRRRVLTSRPVEEFELRMRLEAATHEHRDLDTAIDALRSLPSPDQIQLARMKKRKLRLRDDIAHLSDMLIPDIIA